MRVANILVMSAAAMLVWACATTQFPDFPGKPEAKPASVEVSGNDCAVMAAVAKEHYKFGPDNPPHPLRVWARPAGGPSAIGRNTACPLPITTTCPRPLSPVNA